MSKRTITLTGRTPVSISDEAWPVLASAADKEHDGEVESRANCKSAWTLKVRQHADGRAIVYAVYDYDSVFRGDRNYAAKRGKLLSADATAADICDAIREVAADIAEAEHHDDDASRWVELAAECIADMPAEELP